MFADLRVNKPLLAEYQDFIESIKADPSLPLTISKEKRDFLHAALGIATESGEVVDILKKHFYYGREIDETHLKEELGDLLWYIGLMANSLNVTLEAIILSNMKKLKKRYPEGSFSQSRANNRKANIENREEEV